MGTLEFACDNDAGDPDVFWKMEGTAINVADGSEEARMTIKFKSGGGGPKDIVINDGTYGITLEDDSRYGVIRVKSTSTYSDATLKENVTPVSNALDMVKRLQGVRYDWIKSGESDIGFLAQDVKEVVPEVVKGAEGDMGIDYSKLTTILAEAVKDLAAQVEELKN
jgi:hypothetical protein